MKEDMFIDLESWFSEKTQTGTPAAHCHTPEIHKYRKAYSETQVLDIMPHDPEPGASYHVLSGGKVDALSYLKYVLRRQNICYCLLSTWCMAMEDVREINEWIQAGKIARFDVYAGEIFPNSYTQVYNALLPVIEQSGGRVGIFKNHSKIICAAGPKFKVAIESSANVNTNPRTENTCLHFDAGVFEFYKQWFDTIKTTNKQWRPWKR
jgi:hypothetical protein